MAAVVHFIASPRANTHQTLSAIACDALRAAAVAPSDRAALDVAGKALRRLVEFVRVEARRA